MRGAGVVPSRVEALAAELTTVIGGGLCAVTKESSTREPGVDACLMCGDPYPSTSDIALCNTDLVDGWVRCYECENLICGSCNGENDSHLCC